MAFDLDGVLVDTSPCHAQAYEALWQTIGVSGPPYASLAGRRTHEAVREITAGLRPSERQIQGWVQFKQDRARAAIRSQPVLFEDAARLLDLLHGKDLVLALVTGASRETCELLLSRFELSERFDVVITGDDVPAGKPSPEGYARAIEIAGAEPDRTLAVEDSEAGAVAALGAAAWVAAVRGELDLTHPHFLGHFTDLDHMAAELQLTNP